MSNTFVFSCGLNPAIFLSSCFNFSSILVVLISIELILIVGLNPTINLSNCRSFFSTLVVLISIESILIVGLKSCICRSKLRNPRSTVLVSISTSEIFSTGLKLLIRRSNVSNDLLTFFKDFSTLSVKLLIISACFILFSIFTVAVSTYSKNESNDRRALLESASISIEVLPTLLIVYFLLSDKIKRLEH